MTTVAKILVVGLLVGLAVAASARVAEVAPVGTSPSACHGPRCWSAAPLAACKGANCPTNTPTPTATPVPTATPTPAGAGQPCTAAQHDAITATGPDGQSYPTWHPAVDPVTGCVYGHEHGADPRTSLADSSMPAFGYAAAVAGMVEPHQGFKVFVANAGETDADGGTIAASARLVHHTGTSGVGRYTTQFHSLEYDYTNPSTGKEFHVVGMADTGPTSLNGSTCDTPRKGAKDFSTLGCNDPYEIWNSVKIQLFVPGNDDIANDALHLTLYASTSLAVFDPITTRDPADNTRVVYSQTVYEPTNPADPLSTAASFKGCARENYVGPNYVRNAGHPTTYYTDAYGNAVGTGQAPDAAHPIAQTVYAGTSTDNVIYKKTQNVCSATIHAPN